MFSKVKNMFGTSQKSSAETKKSLRQGTSMASLGRRFTKDEDGNIMIMFAFGSLMLFTLAGMAIDYTRYNLVLNDLVEAMDASGLAMASYQDINPNIEQNELLAFGRNLFFENFQYEDLVNDLDIQFALNNTTVSPSVTGTLNAILLRPFSFNGVTFNFTNFDLASNTEITRRGSGKIELSLVLDVTGSMGNPSSPGGPDKIDELKDSVDILLDVLFGDDDQNPNLKVGVVPFNANVNPGGGTNEFDNNWVDEDAQAVYHGARFIHTVVPTGFDTSGDARATNSNPSFSAGSSTGLPLMFDPATKVNHQHLFNSSDQYEWAGCMEARPYPLDEIDIPPGATPTASDINSATGVPAGLSGGSNAENRTLDAFNRSPNTSLTTGTLTQRVNTLFVPSFQPDMPDCSFNDHRCFNHNPDFRSRNINYGSGLHRVRTSQNTIDRPGRDNLGYSDNAYEADSYLRDFTIGDDQNPNSTRFLVYGDFVNGFRHSLRVNHSPSSYWGQVESFFTGIGANQSGGHFFNQTAGREYIARTAYVGLFNPATNTYNFRYDSGASYSLTNDRSPNGTCPDPIVPLTSTRSEVSDAVNDLEPRGFTNSATGAMWGWRVLSPEAPFTQGVQYNDNEWQKAVVIMTDGENVIGFRDTHLGSTNTAYGYASEERMGQGVDTNEKMRNQIDDKMLRICQRMKDEGILVYTIVFGLDSDNAERLYRACATEPNAPYFQDAANGVDLEESFSNIAADLVNLHISQ